MAKLKQIVWIGSSLNDLKALPEEVQKDTGFILDRVQRGMFHKDIKPLKGLSGVQEIRVDFDKDTYRSAYMLNLGEKIYMLHVFKKSRKGIATPKPDMDVIRARLKRAKEEANSE